MKIIVGFSVAILVGLFVMFPSPLSSAMGISQNTEFIPLDGSIVLEKKVISMHIPADNELPWGFVEGQVINYVEGYPVIIQIFKEGEPVHVAQTDVNQDGSYEYKFRARSVIGDQVINIFEGDYAVKIFKVVYLNPNTISA